MAKNKRLQILIENIELILLIVLSGVFLGIDLLSDSDLVSLDQGSGFAVIIAFMGLFAFNALRDHISRQRQYEQLTKSDATLENVARYFKNLSPKVDLVAPSDQPEIWEGFVGDYLAWNAPFRVEEDKYYKEALDIHVARYGSSEFRKAQYLHFSGDPGSEREVFDRRYNCYRSFMNDLSKKYEPLSDKLETYVINESSPDFSFFIGKQNESDVCILYINIDPFMIEDVPLWAFVIKEPSIIDWYRVQFERKRLQAHPISLHDLLANDQTILE
jgi:hypothetical protein